MAMSSYGNYKNKKNKTVLYYIIAAIIIAAVAAVFLYSPSDKDETEKETTTIEQNTETTIQQTPVKQAETSEPSQNQNTAEFTGIPADANNLAGPRVLALLKDAQNCIAEQRIIAARDTLNDVLNMALDDNLRQQIKSQMQALADDWLFSRTLHFGDGLCSTYKVMPGDMLSSIAAKHKVPYQFLMRINNISNERSLRSGQVIKVAHGPFHAIAYQSSFTMDLYLQNVYVKSYKIGIGRPGHETPAGLWKAKIGGKLIKPTWTDPDTGKTFQSDDPDYPLGSGWIALEGIDSRTRGIEGIAIHGTKDENSIGTKSSRGCIRLYNGELIELYNMFEGGCSELRVVD